MCKGAGGSSNQTSSVSIPQDVLAKYNQVWNMGQTAASTPFQTYSGEFVAPVTGTTQGGINTIAGAGASISPTYAGQTQQIYNGLNNSYPAFNQASGSYTGAAGLAGASTTAVNPSELNAAAINQYMSPYIQGVVNPMTNWFNQQNALQQTGLTSNAISQGAFGGDRSGIASAVLSGQQNLAEAPQIASLYNQGYGQALAAAQQQQGVNLAAGQANRAALQTGSQLMSGVAGGETNLANSIFGNQFQAANAIGSAGNQAFQNTMAQGQGQTAAGLIPQQTQQAQDTALYNQFLMQQAYPFQTTQFLGNLAMGMGPLQGSTTAQNAFQPQPFFSDDKLKEDVHEIGRTSHGLKIVRYRYKEDPHKLLRIGFLASDVEKKMPDAVTHHESGLRSVDYDRAARASGGGLVIPTNDNMRAGYAGGGAQPGFDPATMAAIVAAQQAMYPGAAGRPGIGGTGPRGMQLGQAPHAQLKEAPLLNPKQQQPELAQDIKAAEDLGKTGKDLGSLYDTGKDALVGSAAKGTAPATGGLIGSGGSYDWNSGWLGQNTGAGVAAPAPLDLAPTDAGAWRAHGGRLKRAAGGGSTTGFIPYDEAGGYVPQADYQPYARSPGGLQQGSGGKGAGPGGSGGGSPLGTLSSLAGLGKTAASGISGLSGLFGGTGADALPMSGLGGLTGDAALGAAGTFGAADAGAGIGADALMGLFALKRGGRAGYQDGGDPTLDDTQVAEAPPPTAGLVVPQRDNVVPFVRNPERPAAREETDKAAAAQARDEAIQAKVERDAAAAPAPTTAGVVPQPTTPVPGPLPGVASSTTATPPATPSGSGFNAAVDKTLSHEGGFNQRDANGAPVNMGINQAYHPDVDVTKLTRDQAKDIYKKQYWDAIDGDHLDPKIQAMAFDTAVISGPERAKQFLAQSGGDPAKFMQLRAQYENGLVASDPAKYGKYANTWATRRASYGADSMNVQNTLSGAAIGPGSGTPPPTAGVAGDPGFFDKNGWLDRNERYIAPALSFLGGMLSSPSRTLAGSIGSGMVQGANAILPQQRLGQEQQRIDITQRSQLLNVWSNMSSRIAAIQAALPPGAPEPAELGQLKAQAAAIWRQISQGTASAPPGGPDSAAGGPSAGLVPQAAQPGGAGVAPQPASPAPSVATTPLPPPPAMPAPIPAPALNEGTKPPAATPAQQKAGTQETASNAWWPKDQPKPWVQAQSAPALANIKDDIDPNRDPAVLRKKALEAAPYNPALAETLRNQALTVENLFNEGKYPSKDGTIKQVPGFAEWNQAQGQQRVNLDWSNKQRDNQTALQAGQARLKGIQESLEALHTGPWSEKINEVAGKFKQVTGIDVPLAGRANPAAFDEFMKNALGQVYQQMTASGAPTDAKLEGLFKSTPNPALQPEANRRILAYMMALNNRQYQQTSDAIREINAYPQMNKPVFDDAWQQHHDLDKDIDKYERNIAVLGATPTAQRIGANGRREDVPDPARLKEGQAYIIPYGGKNVKARFKGLNEDGKPKWETMQ